MTQEELKTLIDSTVKGTMDASIKNAIESAIAPLQETQRRYGDLFEKAEERAKEEDEKKKSFPGMTFTRVVKCLTLAKNDPEKAFIYATGGDKSNKGMYPEDKKVHALLKQLSATTPSEGGFLIAEQYAADIIPLLLSKTAVMELGARRIPMPKGNLNLPKLTGGATSYYQGENQNATKSQQTFGNIKLSSKKLVTLVPVSNDLIRDASYEADMIIRDDMMQQMRLKIDYTAMYGDGTAYTPLGIKKSISTANITTATGSSTLTGDVPGTMIGALMNDNTPMISVGWIFNSRIWSAFYNLKTTTNQYIYRDEMNRGTLNGFPFRISNQITTANSTAGTTYFDIFLGDFSEFMFGDEMAFEVMASQEAAWYDGSSLQSAFSLDQTVLKLTSKHDMALRHNTSFLSYNYPYQ
jgi:HK97 family phage major capsid protein